MPREESPTGKVTLSPFGTYVVECEHGRATVSTDFEAAMGIARNPGQICTRCEKARTAKSTK